MKPFKLLFAAFLLIQSFTAFSQESKTVYFYAVGWEQYPQTEAAKLNAQPVLSNVVSINCGGYIYNSALGVDNQLVDYYVAYYAKQRGFMALNRTTAFGPFDTWDAAENDRRKKIADYNYKWKPLVLTHFRYLCDE
jgi:hypothetical protein